jgi:hypothetical protein
MYKATSRFRQRLARAGKKVTTPNVVIDKPFPTQLPQPSRRLRKIAAVDRAAAARQAAERATYAQSGHTSLLIKKSAGNGETNDKTPK